MCLYIASSVWVWLDIDFVSEDSNATLASLMEVFLRHSVLNNASQLKNIEMKQYFSANDLILLLNGKKNDL